MQKLIEQFDFEWNHSSDSRNAPPEISDERATLLFLIDTYNKHLLEIEGHPVRKVREVLDGFAKELLASDKESMERVLFRFRQFFSSYRIDEFTYIQRTFEDFRAIVWDFVDQLSEDLDFEKSGDQEVRENLEELKEAVEANSINSLKTKSREFIDFYTEYQTRKDAHRDKRLNSIKKNLTSVQKKLVEANNSMRLDHLTGAHNRKSFDESIQQLWNMAKISKSPCSLIVLDIDHFKKINDTYGHDVGDFIIQQCVRLLQQNFNRGNDLVARVGGEEFAVILPDDGTEQAVQKAEEAMKKIRNEVFIQGGAQIKFTVSMGIAQMHPEETVEEWVKRADSALYTSKNSGRNRYTVADGKPNVNQVA